MSNLRVLVEASARHVHVSAEHLAILYGPGAQLHKKRDLSQPGEFLTDEKLTLSGPRGTIERVSILGPERAATQVEISLTDARVLGVNAPVRESGDVAGSAAITLIGPAGKVELAEGCIAAKRHIHLTNKEADQYGLKNKQIVSVKLDGERGVTLHQVVCRVSDKFAPAMHIDYDESNAAMLTGETYGEVLVD